MEEHGGSLHVVGVDLGFTCVEHVHDVAVFLVDRDLEAGDLFLAFFFHPLAGIDPVFGGHVHLGAIDAVHAGADLHFPGAEALRVENAAQVAHHDAHVDAVGAVVAAAVAAGALAPGDVHGADHEFGVHLAVAADHFTESGVDLVGRSLLHVAVIGLVEEAGIGAERAVGADFQPGARTGLAGLFEGVLKSTDVDFHVLHFFIILLAALVGEESLEILFRIDRLSVAENTFRHILLHPL